jgi:hypothetical protein
MPILITSFRKVLVAIFFIFPVIAFSQSDTKLFIQKDSIYKFYYPADWKTLKTYEADLHLQIPKVEGQVRCELKSKTQNITGGFTNASIRELAAEEERITRETLLKMLLPGNTVNYLKSSFEKINGKEWWIFEYVMNSTGFRGFKFYTRVWKTVHNSKAYSLEYSASDNNFANNFDQAQAIINSYNFLNKDETVYKKPPVTDKTTASSASNSMSSSTSSGAAATKEKDQAPVAQPGKVITSIPSSEGTENISNTAMVEPIASIEKTEEEIKQEEEKREADLIKSCASGFVKRKAAGLIEVKLGNGKVITLKDKDAEEESERYKFDGCIPSFNAYLFKVGGWENETWLLLNKTDGTKTWLANVPILSPDEKRLICTLSGENDAGYDYNYVGIWSFVNGKPKKEFELTEMTWGAGEATWLSNTSIKIETEKYDGNEVKKLKPKTATLVNGKWIIK